MKYFDERPRLFVELFAGGDFLLFNKKIEPRCVYCQKGRTISEDRVACAKRGIMPGGGSCRAFKYDPLKRVPPKPVRLSVRNVSDEDFNL